MSTLAPVSVLDPGLAAAALAFGRAAPPLGRGGHDPKGPDIAHADAVDTVLAMQVDAGVWPEAADVADEIGCSLYMATAALAAARRQEREAA